MRWFLVLVAAVTGVGISLGLSTLDADAGPLPAISAPLIAPTLIEQTGYWKRYCRRYGCGPDVVLPDEDVDVDADDDAPAAVIVLPPPRPASCGQYRYWDGERCVDARYNNPYLGPR
jgi:hypothetical protein